LQLQCVLQKIIIVHTVQMLLLLLLRLTTMKLLLQTCLSVAAAVPVVAGVDAHFVLSRIAFWAHEPAVLWQHTASNNSLLLQGFVKYTKVGVYRMQQVWEQAAAQRDIMAAFLSDSRIKYELGSSKLALQQRCRHCCQESHQSPGAQSTGQNPCPTCTSQQFVEYERNSRSNSLQARTTMGSQQRLG